MTCTLTKEQKELVFDILSENLFTLQIGEINLGLNTSYKHEFIETYDFLYNDMLRTHTPQGARQLAFAMVEYGLEQYIPLYDSEINKRYPDKTDWQYQLFHSNKGPHLYLNRNEFENLLGITPQDFAIRPSTSIDLTGHEKVIREIFEKFDQKALEAKEFVAQDSNDSRRIINESFLTVVVDGTTRILRSVTDIVQNRRLPEKWGSNSSIVVGNIVDYAVKYFVNNRTKTYEDIIKDLTEDPFIIKQFITINRFELGDLYGYSKNNYKVIFDELDLNRPEVKNAIITALKDLSYIFQKIEISFPNHYIIDLSKDSKFRIFSEEMRLVGETDIIAVNKTTGEITVINIKARKYDRESDNRAKDKTQISIYSQLIENKGFKVSNKPVIIQYEYRLNQINNLTSKVTGTKSGNVIIKYKDVSAIQYDKLSKEEIQKEVEVFFKKFDEYNFKLGNIIFTNPVVSNVSTVAGVSDKLSLKKKKTKLSAPEIEALNAAKRKI